MNRSSAIDILLTILGTYLILQFLGGLRNPSFLPGIFVGLAFASLGGLLIFVVYDRRKKRAVKARQQFDELNKLATMPSVAVSSLVVQYRPRSVTILGFLANGNGVAILVTGFLSLLLAQVVAIASSTGTLEQFREEVFGILGPISESPDLLRTFLVTVGFTSIALGVAFLIGGYGLLKGRKWAWRLAIILALSAITFDLVMALQSNSSGSTLENEVPIPPIGLIIGAAMLYLLFRQDVKSHFGRTKISRSRDLLP